MGIGLRSGLARLNAEPVIHRAAKLTRDPSCPAAQPERSRPLACKALPAVVRPSARVRLRRSDGLNVR